MTEIITYPYAEYTFLHMQDGTPPEEQYYIVFTRLSDNTQVSELMYKLPNWSIMFTNTAYLIVKQPLTKQEKPEQKEAPPEPEEPADVDGFAMV